MAAADPAVRRWRTCGEAWIALLRHVWSAGEAGMEDQGPIIEGPPTHFEIASLSWEDPLLLRHGERELMPCRARGRTRGRPGPEDGASGLRLRDRNGADQLRWVVGLLRARPWTTSAWISLVIPGDPSCAVPCLVALSFRIRGYRLGMTALFRSQDVVRGYLAYIPLREVQARVAEELGLPAGPLRIFVDVPHIALADAERVAGILTALPEPHAA
ncbi:hypothetical protein ACFY4C_09475 [Actinomadura viridis]|uniref:hypothetical protein n=1 Tax=Actinomadura viridis TaxID=58110 RepID=UPI0036A282A9